VDPTPSTEEGRRRQDAAPNSFLTCRGRAPHYDGPVLLVLAHRSWSLLEAKAREQSCRTQGPTWDGNGIVHRHVRRVNHLLLRFFSSDDQHHLLLLCFPCVARWVKQRDPCQILDAHTAESPEPSQTERASGQGSCAATASPRRGLVDDEAVCWVQSATARRES
jgi:hypothetical protein